MDEQVRRSRRRSRTVSESDDSALVAFISVWLARRGLETVPIGGNNRTDGVGRPVGNDGSGTPGQIGGYSAAAATPSVTYVNRAGGPGSPLVYPVPSPDPWVDPLPHLSLGPVDIDTGRRSVSVLGEEVHTTPTEFRLLCYLVEHSDRVVGHRELLLSVWGPGYGDDVHLLQVTIRDLRARIAHLNEWPLIESVYGTGYRMASWPSGTRSPNR
jgi:DNA-binding winged helix-turn-helix (wHTH) protein